MYKFEITENTKKEVANIIKKEMLRNYKLDLVITYTTLDERFVVTTWYRYNNFGEYIDDVYYTRFKWHKSEGIMKLDEIEKIIFKD